VSVRDQALLEAAAAEIEAHAAAAGWDRPPALFALVPAGRFAADDPATAARLGLDRVSPDTLTPVEQPDLGDGPLDEALAHVAWPESVAGCALSQEILIIPPTAEADVPDDGTGLAAVAAHPERREARLVVAVLRDGSAAAVLRLRGREDGGDELLHGAQLAPNLTQALIATLH
jgi:hypothetical protein